MLRSISTPMLLSLFRVCLYFCNMDISTKLFFRMKNDSLSGHQNCYLYFSILLRIEYVFSSVTNIEIFTSLYYPKLYSLALMVRNKDLVFFIPINIFPYSKVIIEGKTVCKRRFINLDLKLYMSL